MRVLQRFTKRFLVPFLLVIASFPASAALNAYAELTLDTTPLDGQTTMGSIGGVDVSTNHIEIYEYSQTAAIGEKGKELILGPLILLKRQDNTSPVLIKGLIDGQVINGLIKFFGNDPDSGETRLESTVEIINGVITSIEQRLPDAFDPSQANRPTLDIITIKAGSIIWTHELSGSSSSWSSAL